MSKNVNSVLKGSLDIYGDFSYRHLRFIDEDFLRSGWLPNVPDADDGAAVKTHSTGFSCRAVH